MCNMDCFHCELEDCIMDGVTQEEKEAQDQRDMRFLTVFNPQKEAQKRYQQSEKRKETRKRYQQSEKGKETRKHYRQSRKKKENAILNLSESFRTEE